MNLRLVDIEYVGKMEAVVFRFADGRILGVPMREIKGPDPTPVIRISLLYDGDAALIEQFSGNRWEISCDHVLHLAGVARLGQDARTHSPLSSRPAGARFQERRREAGRPPSPEERP